MPAPALLPAEGVGWAADGPTELRAGAGCGEAPAPARSSALDRLRGLAILCMVVDHVALFAGWVDLRTTVGRVAMPLFFVLGGHLARRYSWRALVGVPLVGLGLQLFAPWSGAGPLLLCFAAGVVLVVGLRRVPVLLVLVAGWGLLLGANGYAHLYAGNYDPRLLLALMAFGAVLDRAHLEQLGRHLPRFLAVPGRRPLTWYAGHVLLLGALWSS